MTDIVLTPITSGYNLSKINANFVKVQDVINGGVLHTTGGNNTMQQDVDMNSNRILNLPAPISGLEPLRLQDLIAVDSGNALQLKVDLADGTDLLKGVTMVAGAGRVVEVVDDLRDLPKTGTKNIFVTGYYEAGDGGGGHYYLDALDTTSVDNGGSVIVATDGGRWKLTSTGEISVKQFGAVGDGVADDTVAIQAAFNALSGGNGALRFPTGVYNYTLLVFDSAIGLRLIGDGAINTTVLRCTSVLAAEGIKLRSTFDCTASFITFDHSDVGFTGYLVELNHKPASAIDTQGMYFERCTFGSQGFNKYTAKGVNLDQSTLITFEGCKFVSLLRPLDGQNPAGGGYANGIRVLNCQFADNVGYALNYLGEQWTIQDTNFQACHDGAQRIAFSTNVTTWQQLVFINNGVYDAVVVGPAYLNLGNGGGLSVIGGMWGGRSDLGTSTFLDATGIINGISVKASRFSLFTNVYVASVSNQNGWDLSGGSRFVSCTNILINPANVLSKSLDLNVPESSLGVLPVVSGAASIRYNQDMSIEMTGALTVASGSTVAVVFPTAFPAACWDVQLTLQTSSALTNVVSLTAAPANTGFSVHITGAGSNTLRWRAIGR